MPNTIKYYAVAKGRKTGVFQTWEKCRDMVHGYPSAQFRRFSTLDEANQYLESNGVSTANGTKRPTREEYSVSAWPTQEEAISVWHDENDEEQMGSSILTWQAKNNDIERPSKMAKVIRSSAVATPDCRQTGVVRVSNIRQVEGPQPMYQYPSRVTILFDGGSRGNPGVAGAGACITVCIQQPFKPETELQKTIHLRKFVGNQSTNNFAEYMGVLEALRAAYHELDQLAKLSTLSPDEWTLELCIQGDSLLVIKQLQGEWKVKHTQLRSLHDKAMNLIRRMKTEIGSCTVRLEHIPRENNHIADGLANAAMNSRRSWFTTSDDGHRKEFPLIA